MPRDKDTPQRPSFKAALSFWCKLGWISFGGTAAHIAIMHWGRSMSGSSRSGFTWKEVADVLRVDQISDSAILWREFKRRRKGRIGAKRTPLDTKATNDALPTADQAKLRRPGASR